MNLVELNRQQTSLTTEIYVMETITVQILTQTGTVLDDAKPYNLGLPTLT